MNKISVKLATRLAAAHVGDNLSAADRTLIDEAFHVVRSAAHRAWAKKPRGSLSINELRTLILKFPDWIDEVSPLEHRVIIAKFGSLPDLGGELSNTAAGRRLGFTKQTVAHHLKTAHDKLRSRFGAIEASTKSVNTGGIAASAAGSDLMNDAEWQSLTVWRRALTGNEIVLTEADLTNLRQLATRLKSVTVEPGKSQTNNPPRHRSSPNRFFELRAALIENKSLLELITPRQREVLAVGLALGEKHIDERSELGFRRFPASEAMTFQNFNYFVRESLKRMKLDL